MLPASHRHPTPQAHHCSAARLHGLGSPHPNIAPHNHYASTQPPPPTTNHCTANHRARAFTRWPSLSANEPLHCTVTSRPCLHHKCLADLYCCHVSARNHALEMHPGCNSCSHLYRLNHRDLKRGRTQGESFWEEIVCGSTQGKYKEPDTRTY